MRKTLTALGLSLLVAGCGDAFTPESIAGTYLLRTVNGQEVPVSFNIVDGTTSVVVTFAGGTLTLNADGTYSFSTTVEVTAEGTTVSDTETETGTFLLQGTATVRLVDTEGNEETGTWLGNTVTFSGSASTLVFERQ